MSPNLDIFFEKLQSFVSSPSLNRIFSNIKIDPFGILFISESVLSLIRCSLKKIFFCNRRDNFSDIGFKDIPLTTLPLGLPM